MIHRDSSRPGSSSETWVTRRITAAARAAATALLLLGGIAGPSAGCDSSNGSDQPFPEFEGRWAVDVDTSNVTCPRMEIGMQAISPWSNPPGAEGATLGVVTLEAGVLTDLIETSSECSFGYNVSSKYVEASVANPDPYTGNPSRCVMPLPRADGSSLILTASQTQSPLTFQLEKPVKGKAQVANITGAADATVKFTDLLGALQTYEGCTFAASVKLHKIAKP